MNREHVARFIIAILLFIGIAVPNSPKDAWGASGTGIGTGTVVSPLTIAAINPLAFGYFSPGGSGGTIQVFPNGLLPPAVSGTVIIVTPPVDSQGRGAFRIIGENGRSYTASGDDEITMNAQDGTPGIQTMTADLIYWSQSLDVIGTTSVPGVLGPLPGFTGDILGVAGTLTVPAGVASGSWLGQYQITANYD